VGRGSGWNSWVFLFLQFYFGLANNFSHFLCTRCCLKHVQMIKKKKKKKKKKKRRKRKEEKKFIFYNDSVLGQNLVMSQY